MLRLLGSFFLYCFLSSLAFAIVPQKLNAHKITRVIYITFDGTRWQDVFNEHPYFPKLWNDYAKYLNFYGAPNSNTTMETASIPVSLPSYQAQMAGFVQPCAGNECGRISVETVAEGIVHRLGVSKKEVAIFASWSGIGFASESILDTTYTNAGNVSVVDPDTQQADPVMTDLNQKQILDHIGPDRFDKYTFPQALHYLEKYQPRFLWISFNDADDLAHEGDLQGYHHILQFYDNALDTLFITLKKLHLDQETMVIVT